MFCPSCGAQTPQQAAFCPYCGRQMPREDAALPVAPASQEKPAMQPAPAASLAPEAPETPPFTGYAGFWKRFLAWCLDYILIMTLVSVASFVEGFILELADVDGDIIGGIALAIGIGGPWLYFSLFQASVKQATPGKMALNIYVADTHGQRIGFLRASVRYFGKYLSTLLLMLGFIMAGFTPRKMALHDFIAQTLVLNRPPRPLNA